MLLRRLDSAELRATTDEELLARFVSGDYSAFDVIVGRYEERLLNSLIVSLTIRRRHRTWCRKRS
jgi:hypothetical protein